MSYEETHNYRYTYRRMGLVPYKQRPVKESTKYEWLGMLVFATLIALSVIAS